MKRETGERKRQVVRMHAANASDHRNESLRSGENRRKSFFVLPVCLHGAKRSTISAKARKREREN